MSSLVFLGLSVIAFLISYGLVWILVPMVLGTFFTTLETSGVISQLSSSWHTTYNTTQTTVQWIIPLSATVGLFIFILKVLMVASVRGSD